MLSEVVVLHQIRNLRFDEAMNRARAKLRPSVTERDSRNGGENAASSSAPTPLLVPFGCGQSFPQFLHLVTGPLL